MTPNASIGAIILAAGQSRRMGQPKLILPWGQHTIIEQVVKTLLESGITRVVVVTGGARNQVEQLLAKSPVRVVYNPDYERSEMLTSLQVGMAALSEISPASGSCQAFFVALGDQPGIERNVIEAIIKTYEQTGASLVVPSYQMRRGHPWLVDQSLWAELLAMTADQTMRDFLQAHHREIQYVVVESAKILMDLDTPQDYDAQKPGA